MQVKHNLMKFKNSKNKMYEDQIKFFIKKNYFENSVTDSFYVLKKINNEADL